MDGSLPYQSSRRVYDAGHGRALHDAQPSPWKDHGVLFFNLFFESSEVRKISELDRADGVKEGRTEDGRWKMEDGRWKMGIFSRQVGRKKAGFVPKMTCAQGGRVSWALALARKRKTNTASLLQIQAGFGREVKGGNVRPFNKSW